MTAVDAHFNQAVLTHDLNAMFVTGPGHGGPALLADTWLEGSYTEAWPEVTRDTGGMRELWLRVHRQIPWRRTACGAGTT